MNRSLKLIIILILSLTALGCATMNTVSPMPPDMDAKIKNLAPSPEKALVYVVRPTWLGKPFGGMITANDEYIGTTQGGIYVYAVLSPNAYKFKVTGHDNDAEVMVNLEAGKTYYIYQSVYPAIFRGAVSLALVDEKKGLEALHKCKLGDKLGDHIVD